MMILNSYFFKNPTTITTINDGRLNSFLLRLGKMHRYPFSTLLFNIALNVLASAIRQEKEIKYI